jgi:hypothetical protein
MLVVSIFDALSVAAFFSRVVLYGPIDAGYAGLALAGR